MSLKLGGQAAKTSLIISELINSGKKGSHLRVLWRASEESFLTAATCAFVLLQQAEDTISKTEG